MKMKHIKKFTAGLLFAVSVTVLMPSGLSFANDAPYKTYTFDGDGNMMETQTAYLPYVTISKFDDLMLKNPDDMFLAEDGKIYIADTGNSRIVVGDTEGHLIRVIGEGTLVTPRGVFVSKEGLIYVADRDIDDGGKDKKNGAVVIFDGDGNEIMRYTKPTSPLYGNDDTRFLPLKLVVNDAGIMYVVCESNTNGIVEISPTDGGTFLGYFGTNNVNPTIGQIFRRLISTDDQRAKMQSIIPSTPDNLCIDPKGLIYTVTRGESMETLKHLNIAGSNIIEPEIYEAIPAAVAAGNDKNVYVVAQKGYIYEFNEEGEILYVFGAPDDSSQRVGLCSAVSSIAVDAEDRIYILDSDKAQIQIYAPTEFTNLLHKALNLYADGRYSESKEPLTELLKMNSLFDYANKAMGRAFFQEEDYVSAKYYSKLAKDKAGYSDALWETRNIWLKNNIVTVILAILGLWLLVFAVRKADSKKGILSPVRAFSTKLSEKKFAKGLRFSLYYMRHPIDGSYYIARENKGSVAIANVLLSVFIIEQIITKYLSGFLWKTVREGTYDLPSDIFRTIIVIVGLTLCTYLITTINDGEGTIKKLYCMFVYSLMPYIMFSPVTFVLTHVVTTNEGFLVILMQLFTYSWMAVLFFLGIKEVNNYSVKETIKVVALTVFAALILVLIVFILYVLGSQVIEFITAIIGEVVYRIGD